MRLRKNALVFVGSCMLLNPFSNFSFAQDNELIDDNQSSSLEVKLKESLPERYCFSLQDLKKYQTWIDKTIQESKEKKQVALIVDKASQSLYVIENGALREKFSIELGFNTHKDKIMQGDGTTPEGVYTVSIKKDIGQTRYYKAFYFDYPSSLDRKEFVEAIKSNQIPKDAKIGGDLEVHGLGGKGYNWTGGCIALTNENMDLLFRYGKRGTRITIVRYGTNFN